MVMVKADIYAQVEEALQKVRPFLAADGGDVALVDIDEQMNVSIELLGQCSICSMSAMTMKAGIEEGIRKAVPTIKSVRAVER